MAQPGPQAAGCRVTAWADGSLHTTKSTSDVLYHLELLCPQSLWNLRLQVFFQVTNFNLKLDQPFLSDSSKSGNSESSTDDH
jgi:hypothetical protein